MKLPYREHSVEFVLILWFKTGKKEGIMGIFENTDRQFCGITVTEVAHIAYSNIRSRGQKVQLLSAGKVSKSLCHV